MAEFANSSLQFWRDFKYDQSPQFVAPPCQGFSANGDCGQICDNYVALLDPAAPVNLLACGLWTSLTYFVFDVGLGNLNASTAASINGSLASFETWGLPASNTTYIYQSRNAVAAVLKELNRVTRIQTYLSSESMQGSCAEQTLFPVGVEANSSDISSRLADCLDAICAPRSLDPDLGGIGVFTSLLLQLSIAILYSIALWLLQLWLSRRKSAKPNHLLAMSAALAEFHRNQCYFISAIEIAIVVLNRQVLEDDEHFRAPQIYDLLCSIPLALNGVLPVAFSLSCLYRFGRLTWHILLLSLFTIALSAGVLGSATTWILHMANAHSAKMLSDTDAGPGYDQEFQMAIEVCGPEAAGLTHVLNRDNMDFPLVWLVFAYSVMWVFYCMISHLFHKPRSLSKREQVRSIIQRQKDKILGWSPFTAHVANFSFFPVLAILWALCFVYHFYLYSLFTRSNLVSSEWTFGQIIAVMIWVPSLAELVNIQINGIEEGSKFRYPPGVQAVIRADTDMSTNTEDHELLDYRVNQKGNDGRQNR